VRVGVLLALLGLAAPAALVALASGNAGQGPTTFTAGMTEAVSLDVPDPELAPVVGLARGPSFLGLPLGDAPRRVLAVPAGAPAELGPMEATGRAFDFADPHGNPWHVAEYRAAWGYAYGTATGPVTHDADAGAYNFVLLVDHERAGQQVRIVAA
jgi:hypothetical protein